MESENIKLLKNLDKAERKPLLGYDTDSDYPRPDLRNSPENLIIDGNDGTNESVTEFDPLTDPMKNRKLQHPTSNLDTMIHLLKGNIGTGILAMPDAFKNAGLYFGLFGTFLLGLICTHCMHLLVKCSHELCKRLQVSSLNFASVCFNSFDTGPQGLRKYSKFAKHLINAFLIITQIGFCCVYFVFVAVNLQEVVAYYWIKLDTRVFLTVLLIPMIVLNLVKNLKYLTPFSLVASLLTVSGLFICFYFMLQELPSSDSVKYFAGWKQLPLFFGTAIYSFEGIGIVLPLENNMKNPEAFGGWTGVLNTGMVIVTTLYASVGFFGYLKYGESVRGSLTLNLGDHLLAQLVRVMMAMAILLSYTIQFYVPVNIISNWLQTRLYGDNVKMIGDYLLRVGLVLLTFILAAMIPNLGAVISLVGAISSSALALIFPPILEIVTFWHNGLTKTDLFKDVIIVVFGIMGFAFGSFASIMQILYPDSEE